MSSQSSSSSPLLVLKIDADTYRGTKEGVPRLIEILQRHQAQATFLFTLGPDHTGWALKQVFKPGFFSKVSRTSVVEHYGLKTLMYGVLLPAPHIGRECTEPMRAAQKAGFECGIHTWDHRVWQDHIRYRDERWTSDVLAQCAQQFQSTFGCAASTFGAAGWQMNETAFKAHDRAGYRYASDGRVRLSEDGRISHPQDGPHRLQVDGQALQCIQLPTTLPTLDELLGREINGVTLTPDNTAAYLLSLTETPRDHVFTLHAELEGNKLAPLFDALLTGWKAQGYTFGSMQDLYEKIHEDVLPTSPLHWDELPGRSGQMIVQTDPIDTTAKPYNDEKHLSR